MGSNHVNPVAKMRELRAREPEVSFEKILVVCQPSSRETIVELACIDLIDRIRSGGGVQVEQYLKAAPELLTDTEELLDLIDAEICTRRERGDAPDAAEYVERFPDLATEVGRLFVLDNIESQLEVDAIPARETTPEAPGFRLTRRLCGDSISETYRAQNAERNSCFVRWFETGSRDSRLLNEGLRLAIPPTKEWHPNVLTVGTVEAVGDRLFCVSEFADGLPLSALVINGLTPRKVANWLQAIVMAVAFARCEGRSLGHICSTHVLIDHKDQPRIIGCGLPMDETHPVTIRRNDITNIGTLMFHMLTGELLTAPAQSRDTIESAPGLQTTDDTFSTDNPIDPVLEHICLKCLGLVQPGYENLTSVSDDLTLVMSGRFGPVPHKTAIPLSSLLR